MAIDFPNSPNNGDSFTSNDKTWQYNGTSWVVIAGSVSIDAGSVTASKLANNAVTSAKINAGAVHQTHLTSGLSGITVTTTANRSAAVPSPFLGQVIFLSDVTRLQVWNGSAWTFITNGAPGAPTSLSATALSTTSVSVAFTTGTINGASPTNYKYSLSTNGGSTYGEPTALDPADTVSPVTISGLTGGQTYHIKLRAVSDFGDSPDSTATSIAIPTVPSAPTSLSATPGTSTVSISFTPGADGGSAVTNYQYATSTNGGSTYSSFTALNPEDSTSPITITGLTEGTAYLVKLKAVSAFGASAESSAVSFSTLINVQATLIGGGGGGGTGNAQWASGGSGGGYLEANFSIMLSTNYSTTVGSAGPGQTVCNNSDHRTIGKGGNSIFSTASAGGGQGGNALINTAGIGGTNITTGSSSVIVNYAGETALFLSGNNNNAGGHNGLRNATGDTTYGSGAAGVPNSTAGTHATGNGNGGAGGPSCQTPTAGGGNGSIGRVILIYSNSKTITLGAGLTGSTSTVGANKVTTITAGSGNVSWS